jgi:hypothetical protein
LSGKIEQLTFKDNKFEVPLTLQSEDKHIRAINLMFERIEFVNDPQDSFVLEFNNMKLKDAAKFIKANQTIIPNNAVTREIILRVQCGN